jgi:hypothetical protein
MILELYSFIMLMCGCIVFHELGHLLCLRVYKKPAVLVYKYGAELEINCKDLSDVQYRNVLGAGVVSGVIPILAALLILTTSWGIYFNLGALVIYLLMGCSHDLKEIWVTLHDKEKTTNEMP